MRKRLTEARINSIINEVFEEVVQKKVNKQNIIRKLYTITQPITRGRFHDNGWQGVDRVLKAIEDAGFEVSVNVKDGGYRNSLGGNSLYTGDSLATYWKEFCVEIPVGDKVINGRINANGCGSMEDPFEYYDVTCIFW